MVTIDDVARRAGVSKGSVSLVLNDRPHVSADMRERVMAAVAELHFDPNKIARQLAGQRQRPHSLLVLHPRWVLQHHPAITIMAGMQSAARELSLSLLFAATDADPNGSELGLCYLDEHADDVGGVALMGTSRDDPILERVHAAGLPCIVVNRVLPQDLRISYVSADHYLAGSMAARYLLSLGHRRIIFVGGNESDWCYADRLTAFQRAVERAGLQYNPNETFLDIAEAADFVARRAVPQERATAALAFNDVVALALLDALQRRGLNVPQDCSVIGIDDALPSAKSTPALTTVGYSARSLGYHTIRQLTELISEPELLWRGTVLQPNLVERASCAPPQGLRSAGNDALTGAEEGSAAAY